MSEATPFIEKLLRFIADRGIQREAEKGNFLIKEGDIERSLYFIESGAVRVFYLTEHEEHVVRLGYEGSIINSLSSFIKEQPSEFYIEAIRKTNFRSISKSQLQELVNENEDNLRGYLQLIELLITQQIDREIDLLVTSPTERLQRVLARSPHVFQHIPMKYIASYLRMTPETLSRIRKS